jgi:hypothetical protein
MSNLADDAVKYSRKFNHQHRADRAFIASNQDFPNMTVSYGLFLQDRRLRQDLYIPLDNLGVIDQLISDLQNVKTTLTLEGSH